MNKEQVQKYGEVIKWFCDNPDKGVWLCSPIGEWVLTYRPQWDTVCKYVQNDEYAELRKAQADGKTIQYNNTPHITIENWIDINSKLTSGVKNFTYPCQSYRIKPDEPKFKVGDWIRAIRGKSHIERLTDKRAAELLAHQCLIEMYELWTPQEGDVVILFNDNPEQFTIAKYQTSENGKHHLVSCSGKWTEIFTNCIPYIGQPFEEMK